MTRYFVNQEGDANKFWIIEALGASYLVRFGKVGTAGRESHKVLLSSAACETEVAKLIQEKQCKGYWEVPDQASIPEKAKAPYRPMDEAVFWEIMGVFNWKKAGDDDAVLLPATKKLASLVVDDIFAFEDILAEKLYHLDGEKYAAACYPGQHLDSLSGDAFLYDRCSVLVNGRAFYEAVLQDPTKWPVGMEFESLLYLAQQAYTRKTKDEDYPHLTKISFETGSNKAGWPSLS